MKEFFRLRLAANRQITVPQRLLNLLGMGEGDELLVTTDHNCIQEAFPIKGMPAQLKKPEIEAILEKRRGKSIPAARLIANDYAQTKYLLDRGTHPEE